MREGDENLGRIVRVKERKGFVKEGGRGKGKKGTEKRAVEICSSVIVAVLGVVARSMVGLGEQK